MNLNDPKYVQFNLCKEMLQTADVVRSFKPKTLKPFAELLRGSWDILLTGEGSSRIFPAKRAIHENHTEGWNLNLYTEGCTQVLEYQLADTAVFGASNSGKTKELVRLFKKLQAENHPCFLGLTATSYSMIQEIAHKTRVLDCGKEQAVAATKSVVEQALSYHAIFAELAGKPLKTVDLSKAGDAIDAALRLEIPADVTAALAKAPIIYFAGRNDGVAEELTLKTNEITRKKSAFMEGTYAVHGIEEVMNADEVVVLIDPFPDEEEKIDHALAQGVGMKVIAISSWPTRFPTILIPDVGAYRQYVQLAAGWNLLVEIGLALNIAVDTPVRARKVGNEFPG